MDPKKRRILTIVTLSVTALLVILVVMQGVYIGMLRARLGAETTEATAETVATVRQHARPTPAPPTGPPLAPDLVAPFDPDSWNPFEEMESMHRRMNRMFDDAFGRFGQSPDFKGLTRDQAYSPQIDVTEEDDAYVVRMDLPGAEPSNIEVTVHDQTLTISGTRDQSVRKERDDGTTFRFERQFGSFSRSVTLPGPVHEEAMKTEYEDGVFTVRVPKASPNETAT